jgi:hypothetical protein
MKLILADSGCVLDSSPRRGCRFSKNPPIVSTFILNDSDRCTGGGAIARARKKD